VNHLTKVMTAEQSKVEEKKRVGNMVASAVHKLCFIHHQ
jgi:hypothetical protein